MKQLLLLLICICTYSFNGWCVQPNLLYEVLALDTIPSIIDSKNTVKDSSFIIKSNDDNGATKYSILYPSSIAYHIVITQRTPKKMHIRLLNIGGQILREQWTKALETDLYVKNLKGLFIVEIQYEGGVFSKTILIN